MQVLIKIDKNLYTRLFDNGTDFYDTDDILAMAKAIRKGTPLPKGHGRLGDLDALREEVSSWGMNDYEPSDFTDTIDGSDTIIKADKEGEE